MHDIRMNGLFSRRAVLGATGLLLAAGALPAFAQGAKRPVGVIGSGNIGGSIGALLVKAGHPVMFSSRKPEELKDMVAGLGPLAKAGTVAQAIAFGDVVLIAVPYGALAGIGSDNAAALKGKIVLSASNAVSPRDSDALVQDVIQNGIGPTTQKYLPGTRLVEGFNAINFKLITSEANRPAPKLPVALAGDDAQAMQVVAMLVRDAGFDVVVAGGLKEAAKFYRGGPAVGALASAAEMKQKLGLAP